MFTDSTYYPCLKWDPTFSAWKRGCFYILSRVDSRCTLITFYIYTMGTSVRHIYPYIIKIWIEPSCDAGYLMKHQVQSYSCGLEESVFAFNSIIPSTNQLTSYRVIINVYTNSPMLSISIGKIKAKGELGSPIENLI